MNLKKHLFKKLLKLQKQLLLLKLQKRLFKQILLLAAAQEDNFSIEGV